MYKYTADANPKYALDVKAYLAHRQKVKPEDRFEVYDLGEADSEEAAESPAVLASMPWQTVGLIFCFHLINNYFSNSRR